MGNERPTIYTGVTSDIDKRVWQHKNNLVEGFTKKYNLHKLLYFEYFETIQQAIIREKQIKDMNRVQKLVLIKGMNPSLRDLYQDLHV